MRQIHFVLNPSSALPGSEAECFIHISGPPGELKQKSRHEQCAWLAHNYFTVGFTLRPTHPKRRLVTQPCVDARRADVTANALWIPPCHGSRIGKQQPDGIGRSVNVDPIAMSRAFSIVQIHISTDKTPQDYHSPQRLGSLHAPQRIGIRARADELSPRTSRFLLTTTRRRCMNGTSIGRSRY